MGVMKFTRCEKYTMSDGVERWRVEECRSGQMETVATCDTEQEAKAIEEYCKAKGYASSIRCSF